MAKVNLKIHIEQKCPLQIHNLFFKIKLDYIHAPSICFKISHYFFFNVFKLSSAILLNFELFFLNQNKLTYSMIIQFKKLQKQDNL